MTILLDPTSNSFCEINIKKVHHPNWKYQQTLALIEAKWKELIMWLDVVDPGDHFKISTNKWRKFVNIVNTSQHLPLTRNSSRCKDKWGPIYGDFKQTFDDTSGTCNNTKYWEFIPQEKIALNVLKHFSKFMYELIDSFMGKQPVFHPPCVQNMMSFGDYVCCFHVLHPNIKAKDNVQPPLQIM
jgi:hypothetical protein